MTSIDIPILRGDEVTYVTVETDDPDLFSEVGWRLMQIDDEVGKVRGHLLVPRDQYPDPPKWDDWKDTAVRLDRASTIPGTEICRVDAVPNGIAIFITDDDGTMPEEPDVIIPWTDVLKAVPSEALVNEIRRDDRYRALVRVLIEKLRQKPYEASPEQVARYRAERSRDRAMITRYYLD